MHTLAVATHMPRVPHPAAIELSLYIPSNKQTKPHNTDKAGHDLFSSEKPEAIERMQEEQKRKHLTKVT